MSSKNCKSPSQSPQQQADPKWSPTSTPQAKTVSQPISPPVSPVRVLSSPTPASPKPVKRSRESPTPLSSKSCSPSKASSITLGHTPGDTPQQSPRQEPLNQDAMPSSSSLRPGSPKQDDIFRNISPRLGPLNEDTISPAALSHPIVPCEQRFWQESRVRRIIGWTESTGVDVLRGGVFKLANTAYSADLFGVIRDPVTRHHLLVMWPNASSQLDFDCADTLRVRASGFGSIFGLDGSLKFYPACLPDRKITNYPLHCVLVKLTAMDIYTLRIFLDDWLLPFMRELQSEVAAVVERKKEEVAWRAFLVLRDEFRMSCDTVEHFAPQVMGRNSTVKLASRLLKTFGTLRNMVYKIVLNDDVFGRYTDFMMRVTLGRANCWNDDEWMQTLCVSGQQELAGWFAICFEHPKEKINLVYRRTFDIIPRLKPSPEVEVFIKSLNLGSGPAGTNVETLGSQEKGKHEDRENVDEAKGARVDKGSGKGEIRSRKLDKTSREESETLQSVRINENANSNSVPSRKLKMAKDSKIGDERPKMRVVLLNPGWKKENTAWNKL